MSDINRVAVIGCGTIGMSWASLFLAHGLEVQAYDPAPGREAPLRDFIAVATTSIGRPVPADTTALRWCMELEDAVGNVEFVQENGPDAEDAKRTLLAAIDRLTPAHSVIATSTSSQIRSAITADCRHPERHIVAHPFNPPHLVPLVEILGGADWAVERSTALYRRLGRHPIVMRREMRGHIANRLTSALWREALFILQEGGASVADIDDAVRYGPGLRWAIMGPYLTYHLAGGPGGIRHFLDHLLPGHVKRWAELGTPVLDADLEAKIVQGVLEALGDRSIADCMRARDAMLVALASLSSAADDAQDDLRGDA
ncbi:3-hydroxyacyl-CoA dehydrogenase NAD-binding domain-containing protein [Methylobacterium brachythecii]|uniref:Hydroxyacyl-CoA dehydrogenase n=1 Tax=Methylobacterium brachythecii TaxID=1176177 RepID=A0A7W6ALI1_9HYPH|nr:3-hydroxyacyl-CoA dehydrogenase NAD-binding domain-containing protein [Methylobacterium brachythecii]MBB3904828.1 3-hydroxyacyl-CoA dehydrogenase [Methylobacterium brachythecii]GLS45380.1 hydroxyacyl-CoA dehydrogenase [Methylobacterium brachythecii]